MKKTIECSIDLTSDRKGKLSDMDIRFVELYNTAVEIAKRGGGEFQKWRTRITVGPMPSPSDLEHLNMLLLNGQWYSFTPCYKDRSAAAAAGLLGSMHIAWGKTGLEDVARRVSNQQAWEALLKKRALYKERKDARRDKARQECTTLWGDELAPAIWEYNSGNHHPEVKRPGFVTTVRWALTWLRSSDLAEGKLPARLEDALNNRYLSRKIAEPTDAFWKQVVACAEYLYKACPVVDLPVDEEAAEQND